jgi:hypothetical protein
MWLHHRDSATKPSGSLTKKNFALPKSVTEPISKSSAFPHSTAPAPDLMISRYSGP